MGEFLLFCQQTACFTTHNAINRLHRADIKLSEETLHFNTVHHNSREGEGENEEGREKQQKRTNKMCVKRKRKGRISGTVGDMCLVNNLNRQIDA